MPISPFLASLRSQVGHSLLLMPSATACVFDDDGRLLIALHETGVWAPPGGAVDPDESPADAAVRELREELDLEIAVDGLIGAYGGPEFRVLYPNGDLTAYVLIAYGCRVVGDGVPVPDGEEVTDARFVTEEELSGYRLPSWTPLVLPDAFAWWRRHRA
ncbi:NUDIX domain-containing protein [Bailinhaonella thermotolerans]|uniref:NUDIX domain-containing protein n=1 Tax=Bailinhaonella thermotolerans TaxID=1070861 RepID=A0A3A4B5L3_9ACTN|nr:NUDIX domain-containing protein [Bailinhaonella thermotolerans]RJL32702.1 NUDIX domain-containing protein [Bailinhaonella thermotolerans]